MAINEEKIDTEWLNSRKKNYFCKKYGSHERRLLNFSYLCNVAENLSQT